MDIYILFFLVAMSIVLFIISRLTHTAWLGLSLGWIAGGLLIIIGFIVWNGEPITSTAVFADKTYMIIPLTLGISTENFLIITALIGLVMIFSSSGDWI